MPTLRVYASDSCTANITAKSDGRKAVWSFEGGERRDTTVETSVYYNFVAKIDEERANSPPFNDARLTPAPDDAAGTKLNGARLWFDLQSQPELQGKTVTGISSLHLYLRYKDLLGVRGYNVNTYREFNAQTPFLIWLDKVPEGGAYPSETASGTENLPDRDLFGKAQPLQYHNFFPAGLPVRMDGGTLLTEVTVGAAVYPFRININYKGHLTAEFDSHTGEFPPYVEVAYEDSPVAVAECSPQTGFFDERRPGKLYWKLVPAGKHTIGIPIQRSAEIQWRIRGDSVIHTVPVHGPDGFAELPANTFPDGEVEWRVSVTSEAGMTSAFSPWYALTTRDTKTQKPDWLSPDIEYCDGALPVTLTWRHNSPVGTLLSAYEIELDLGGGGGWTGTGGKILSSEAKHLLAAGTLPSGTVQWRVRDWNSDGVVSDWSDPAKFTVRGVPEPPVIQSVQPDNPRPRIAWTAKGQQGFQVRAASGDSIAYESGTVFGKEPSFRVTEFLPNGPYRFAVRIQNAFGLWSGWGEASAVLSAPPGPSVRLFGKEIPYGVLLRVELEQPSGPDCTVYFLRDGVPFAKASGASGAAADYQSIGLHRYSARAVDAAGRYADSTEIRCVSRVEFAAVAPADCPEQMSFLKFRADVPPEHRIAVSSGDGSFSFEGRRFAAVEEEGNVNTVWTLSYSLDSREIYDLLLKYLRSRRAVCLRDPFGGRMIGVIGALPVRFSGEMLDVDLILTQTGEGEEIPYD